MTFCVCGSIAMDAIVVPPNMYTAIRSVRSPTTCMRRLSFSSWQDLDIAFEPLEPVQDGRIFARGIGMTEASEFMVGDIVPPLTQLIHDQADIRHGKELILS